MLSVHKYIIAPSWDAPLMWPSQTFVVTCVMPRLHKIISTHMRPEGLCVWAEVDSRDAADVVKAFGIIRTGSTSEEEARAIGKGKFLATVFTGIFVFHIYDLGTNYEFDPQKVKF